MSDSILFQAARIGSLNVPNRFIRSATWEGLAATDGGCTDELVRLMEGLAEGGVGLIVSSHAFVRPEGYAVRGQLGIHRDDLVAGLARKKGSTGKLDGVGAGRGDHERRLQ
jgi:2,4-dienoyl-CoA reductase-like NADH-dependent reductase (Old Yellow Enzyme family)